MNGDDEKIEKYHIDYHRTRHYTVCQNCNTFEYLQPELRKQNGNVPKKRLETQNLEKQKQ